MKRRNFLKTLATVGIAATLPIVIKSKDYFKGVKAVIDTASSESKDYSLFVLIDSDKNILAKGLVKGIYVEQEMIDVSTVEDEGSYRKIPARKTVNLDTLAVEYNDFKVMDQKFKDCEKLGIAILVDENTEIRSLCTIESMSVRIKAEEPIYHSMNLIIHQNYKNKQNGKEIFRKAFGLGE